MRKTINGVMHTWAGPLHWWSGIDSTTGEHHWGWELGNPKRGTDYAGRTAKQLRS